MPSPFPGMDPYLEHPVLWEGLHARLVVAIANRLQPLLDPRYVATVEERVYIEGPQRRIPDVWIQKTRDAESAIAVAEAHSTGAVIVEVEPLEVHESRIEIVDAYNDMKLVTLIELLSPTNKLPGPGFDSYQQKQQEMLERDCHLVEIDLLRRGDHVLAVPEWKLAELRNHNYLACVSRWPKRHRYELYPMPLREPLAEVSIPLADPDPDVVLSLQDVLTQVYDEGRYQRRIRYNDPCEPPLDPTDQEWADAVLCDLRTND
jgi:hypothetical protein